MYNSAGNYVCAGADTFVELMERFIDNNPGYFTYKQLNVMLHNSINSFLYSFGTGVNYKTKRLPKNHIKNFIKETDILSTHPMLDNCNIYWDSGGFQIANGALKTENMNSFIDIYYDLLKTRKDKYTHAFILDLPPGPGSSEIFNSYQEVEDINRISYIKAQNLPKDVKNKIIYIHHFRTPELFNTWMRFMDEGLADGYTYYGTGGIVANLASDIRIPIIIYAIPLACLLYYAKKNNINKIKFHVLGGANFRDVFCHQMFERHIKEYHNIDLTITYDSSQIFKGLAIGRYVQTFTKFNEIVKMDIRSKNLPLRFRSNDITVEDNVYKLCKSMSDIYGFKELSKNNNPIYDSSTNSLSRDIHMYLTCYVLNMYHQVEQMSLNIVNEAYDAYKNSSKDGWDEGWYFNDICKKYTRLLNQGNLSTKARKKSSLFNTLKFLERLDIDECKNIVCNLLSGDDIKFKTSICSF